MLDINRQQVFIPEKYVKMMELLVDTKEYGRGILVDRDDVASLIQKGRIHGNVIINRDLVYVMKEVSATPISLASLGDRKSL